MNESRNFSASRMPVSLTKIGPKHQVVIPKYVFQRLKLQTGDYLEVRTKGAAITMVPKKRISKDQAWFYTPQWQKKEKEADEAIARGEISGPFPSAKELIEHLGKSRKRARRCSA